MENLVLIILRPATPKRLPTKRDNMQVLKYYIADIVHDLPLATVRPR